MNVKNKNNLKTKFLIPILSIFILSVVLIALINYRLLDSAAKSKTESALDIFTDNIIAQIEHLDVILDETKQTLSQKHIAIAKTVSDTLDNRACSTMQMMNERNTAIAKSITLMLEDVTDISPEVLQRISEPLGIIELNIADSGGVIINSSIPDFIGFNYNEYEQTRIYLDLLSGALTELSEEPRISMLPDGTYGRMNHYTGVALSGGGFVQVGFDATYTLKSLEEALTPEALQRLAEPLGVIELNIADSNGIITHSNIPHYIGFDYNSTETTSVYMALTGGTLTELSEEPRISVYEGDVGEINHYTGVSRRSGGFVQLGFNADVIGRLQEEIDIDRTIDETVIGENGFGMVITAGIITAHPDNNLEYKDVSDEEWFSIVNRGNGFAWIEIDGKEFYAGFKNISGATVVGLIPEEDFHRESNQLLCGMFAVIPFSLLIIFVALYIILGKINAEQKARELEIELHKKQVAIMLSQIQPHFLYNALVAIQQLCMIDPKMAGETVVEFARYLRGNLDSLNINEPISFEKELYHVKTYLSIEKKRFDERLNIVYDIRYMDFELPALTLQLIVENAVRYGVTKKISGGTVTITTESIDGNAVITVLDDGAGFDTSVPPKDDGHSHVGIGNARSRLAVMCGGTLEIQSEIGKGTTAVITIPAEQA